MIIENGIHDVPNDVYHNSQGVSRSALMEFKRAPICYWNRYLNPDREKADPTPQMKLGEYVHALVLEPEYFESRYIVEPILEELPKVGLLKDLGRQEFDRQKEQREQVKAQNDLIIERFNKNLKDKESMSQSVYNHACAIANAVLNDDMAKSLLDNAQVEKSIYFTHESTGIQCKVRPDAWCGSIVTDLKTCVDASPKSVMNAAAYNGYYLQAGMIKQALESINIEMEKFVIMAVEKKEPYPVGIYILEDEAINYGLNLFNSLMEQLKECLDYNQWPSYGLQTIGVPRYLTFEESEL